MRRIEKPDSAHLFMESNICPATVSRMVVRQLLRSFPNSFIRMRIK